MQKLVRFVHDCVAEFRRVIWPSKENVISSAKVVLVSTLIMALFLAAVDLVAGRVIFLFLGT